MFLEEQMTAWLEYPPHVCEHCQLVLAVVNRHVECDQINRVLWEIERGLISVNLNVVHLIVSFFEHLELFLGENVCCISLECVQLLPYLLCDQAPSTADVEITVCLCLRPTCLRGVLDLQQQQMIDEVILSVPCLLLDLLLLELLRWFVQQSDDLLHSRWVFQTNLNVCVNG